MTYGLFGWKDGKVEEDKIYRGYKSEMIKRF